ncbi:3-deoxy-D-manno-octulosonic acid transferase [Pseudorhodoferax sp.]|uniref:3-deoxy-D-manno-octulosonic acid transferase n=1 Tax=Pseudorhodoferax sp. TaxID=1993553 RepID=UPI002DD6AFDC|nr:glycosyltransferase N-terminal domain-containing protein [Pseudorhodoferax sp.]
MPTPATQPDLATRLKWQAFRCLERLSDLRGNNAAGHFELHHTQPPGRALWVFVSTIGELNAIDPLLRAVVARLPGCRLVLITDHDHYRDGYLAKYPDAAICVTRGHSRDAAMLARTFPPDMLLVAEIPCWPSDAPCRFSFAFLLEAKRRGAALVLVNGWLYHYTPASRMDSLERNWFQRAYVAAFDAIGAQTEETRTHLVAAGAQAERVSITGNIKFDAMQRHNWTPAAAARSPQMLGALLASGRPTIVAGCVTDFAEQEMLLDAFATLRRGHADALLILAPRHPEVTERMQQLRDYLAQRELPAVFRSSMPDVAIAPETACLVLDTMGELRDFYAAATVAHVGVDHNVLEPLSFGKPVSVGTGWDTTYPSYPVYKMLHDAQALLEVESATQLADIWLALIHNADQYRDRSASVDKTLAQAKGAVGRHLAMLEPWLPPAR